MSKFSLILCLFLIILSVNCNNEIGKESNVTQISEDGKVVNGTSVYTLPKEILDNYAEYESLEEYNHTCTYENVFDGYTEEKLKAKIIRDNCIPNMKTLTKILEAGWVNLSNYLVNELYLPNMIDPTSTIYTYIKKYESQVGKLKYLVDDMSKYEKMPVNYKFENFDKIVKINIPLPDPSFVAEYLSIYCYKDLIKIHAIFRSRQRIIRFTDTKTLFDNIEGECDYSYNSYATQIEILINKSNQLKKWTTLFKN